MKKGKTKIKKRIRRHKRVRSKIFGTRDKPRLSVFRSSQHIFIQLVDDAKGKTILALNSKQVKGKTKTDKAYNSGKELAELAKQKNIKKIVFDRGGYKYQGRIKAVAEGARAGGLVF